MKKKLLAVIMTVAMATVLFTGCSSTKNSETSDREQAQGTEENADASSGSDEGEAQTKAQDGNDAGNLTIVNIPKLLGTAWFDQMLPGLEKWVGEHGGTYYQSGPSTADAALQLQSVEDAITEGVDAIHVVPNSTETLEVAFKKAKDAGIIVITHEAPGAENIDYDVEAFQNAAYGEHFMEALAGFMGEEGGYAIILGSVQAQTHVEWADAAVAYQEANYPNMHLVADYVESGEDHDTAYNKTKELIKTYPDLKGIIGCSVIDPAGAALAVEEAGMEDTISIVGTSIVDVAGNYLDSGAIDMISLWDTEQASYAMCEATRVLAEGGEVKSGDNLGAEGYESVIVDGHVIYGTAWIDITKDNKEEDPYITE